MLRNRFVGYAVLAFVVFFILTNPAGAATTVSNIAAGLASLAASLGDFVTAVSGGAP